MHNTKGDGGGLPSPFQSNAYILRNTALHFRFPLLIYGNVNSRRESHVRLVLLASMRFNN